LANRDEEEGLEEEEGDSRKDAWTMHIKTGENLKCGWGC